MKQLIGDEIAYTDVTELDDTEKAWLLDELFPDLYDLAPQVRRVMFNNLWHPEVSLLATYGRNACVDCGANEGECLNSTCVRTRVTNKLHLNERSI